jgi:hypothetical protein
MKLFISKTVSFQKLVHFEVDVPEDSTVERIEEIIDDSDQAYTDPVNAEWIGTTYVVCRNQYDGVEGCEHVIEWDTIDGGVA